MVKIKTDVFQSHMWREKLMNCDHKPVVLWRDAEFLYIYRCMILTTFLKIFIP